jgi:hypothetical protein
MAQYSPKARSQMVVHRALRAQVLSVLLLRCSSFQLVMLAYFFRVQVLVDEMRTELITAPFTLQRRHAA